MRVETDPFTFPGGMLFYLGPSTRLTSLVPITISPVNAYRFRFLPIGAYDRQALIAPSIGPAFRMVGQSLSNISVEVS
jgi:hypothetical protein